MSDQGNVPVSDCSGPCQASPQLQLYQTIIFATPVLFALLLLILFCILYLRRRRNSILSSQARSQFGTGAFFPTLGYDNGLSKSFRQQLPTVSFDDKFAALNADNHCAVCLGDYELDEKLQQLPVCKHAFHVPCINQWLTKHNTCPICRTSLCQEGNGSITIPVRGNNRQWEERVINEVQDSPLHARPDTSSGGEANAASISASLEMAPRFSVDIERS